MIRSIVLSWSKCSLFAGSDLFRTVACYAFGAQTWHSGWVKTVKMSGTLGLLYVCCAPLIVFAMCFLYWGLAQREKTVTLACGRKNLNEATVLQHLSNTSILFSVHHRRHPAHQLLPVLPPFLSSRWWYSEVILESHGVCDFPDGSQWCFSRLEGVQGVFALCEMMVPEGMRASLSGLWCLSVAVALCHFYSFLLFVKLMLLWSSNMNGVTHTFSLSIFNIYIFMHIHEWFLFICQDNLEIYIYIYPYHILYVIHAHFHWWQPSNQTYAGIFAHRKQ